MSRTPFDIGEIIRDWGDTMFSQYPVSIEVRKSFAAISLCRTYELGGHMEVCPECGYATISYNSCRDRHCPKCQNKDREIWIEKRKEEILPKTKYFHTVFTVPDCLHGIARRHPGMFYTCMFKCAWRTLKAFFKKKGLRSGMTAVLHTWGSNMSYHPHIHCVVLGGGLNQRSRWRHLKGDNPQAKDFLFPVCALSKMFRGKFLAMLTKELRESQETIPQEVRKKCMDKDWVVYSRPPAKGVDMVLEYIGRYVYRAAITNSRILDYNKKDGKVTYDYKDYRHNGVHKTITMHAVEFLHLFAQHILPRGFVRIRHFGILAPSNRNKLRKAQIALGGTPVPEVRVKKSYLEICVEKGWDVGFCPYCKCKMFVFDSYEKSRSPPTYKQLSKQYNTNQQSK